MEMVDLVKPKGVGWMSIRKGLRRIAKGPSMALALILLVLTLASCASTRHGYVSSLWDLADSVWVIVHRVEAVAAEIHQNPQLWQDDSWIQQAVHLCTDVIAASDEVDDLKPPWDMQGVHDAGVKLLGEMRSYAQNEDEIVLLNGQGVVPHRSSEASKRSYAKGVRRGESGSQTTGLVR
jgi:hypothetical protein